MKLKLTDRIIRMVTKNDRKKLGLKTQDEVSAQAEITSEKELHKQVANVLRLRGIEFFDSRMDRKTTRPKGEPDFLFGVVSYHETVPVAWECKMPGKELEPHQAQLKEKMTKAPNFWFCCVIHSVDEALAELAKLGLP